MLLSEPVRALLWKEWREMTRNRGMLLSSTLLPITSLVLAPFSQLYALRSYLASGPPAELGPMVGLPGGSDPIDLLLRFLFPLYVMLAGLLVPSVGSTYSVVGERELRSLELLMILPVRVADILVAKLAAMLLLTAVVLLPLFALDAVVLIALDVASPGYVALLLLVLLASTAYSVTVALLLALLARDLRTANYLNGAMLGPLVPLVVAVLGVVPGDWGLVAVAALLLVAGGVALAISLRWLTFERYLG